MTQRDYCQAASLFEHPLKDEVEHERRPQSKALRTRRRRTSSTARLTQSQLQRRRVKFPPIPDTVTPPVVDRLCDLFDSVDSFHGQQRKDLSSLQNEIDDLRITHRVMSSQDVGMELMKIGAQSDILLNNLKDFRSHLRQTFPQVLTECEQ